MLLLVSHEHQLVHLDPWIVSLGKRYVGLCSEPVGRAYLPIVHWRELPAAIRLLTTSKSAVDQSPHEVRGHPRLRPLCPLL